MLANARPTLLTSQSAYYNKVHGAQYMRRSPNPSTINRTGESRRKTPARALRQVAECVQLTWQPERAAEQLDQQHLQAKQVEPDGW